MSFIPLSLRPFDVNIDTASSVSYTYTNLDDSLATIKGTDYFSKTVEDENNITTALKVNDLLYIHGSDGAEQLTVTAIDPEIVIGVTGVVVVESFLAITTGGNPTEAIPAPNTLSTDNVFTQLIVSTVPAIVIVGAQAQNGIIGVDFSLDPLAATQLYLLTVRNA